MHSISSAVRPCGCGHRALALVPLCLATLCVGCAAQGTAAAIPYACIGRPRLAAAWPTPSLLPCRPRAVPPCLCRYNHRHATAPHAGPGQCLGGRRWSTWRSLRPLFYLPCLFVPWTPTTVSQWWPTVEAMGRFPVVPCFDSLSAMGEPRSRSVTSVQMCHADFIGPVSCERVCMLLLTEPCRSVLTLSCALSTT